MDLKINPSLRIPSAAMWSKPLPLQNLLRLRYRTVIAAVVLTLLPLLWFFGSRQNAFPDFVVLREGHPEIPATASATSTSEVSAAWRTSSDHLIPPKIWQIVLSKKTVKSEKDLLIEHGNFKEIASWLALNPGYSYTMMGEQAALAFIDQHFSDDPRIREAYMNIPNVGMRSDFLRYLILHVEGGTYTDTDTVALKPIDKWVPEQYRNRTRLVVGIEFDRLDGPGWGDILHWVQFCQWTIAAAPGHPVFPRMIERILRALDRLEETHDVPVKQVKTSGVEVMNSTGPAAWTETVFKELMEYDTRLTDIKNISGTREPTLIGDVLVLPIDGFGMGQRHSNSTRGSTPDAALMKHLFYGSWRGNRIE